MSQTELAGAVRVSTSAISMAETGKRPISDRQLLDCLEHMRVSMAEFFQVECSGGGEDEAA